MIWGVIAALSLGAFMLWDESCRKKGRDHRRLVRREDRAWLAAEFDHRQKCIIAKEAFLNGETDKLEFPEFIRPEIKE